MGTGFGRSGPYDRSRAEVSATLTGLRSGVADTPWPSGHVDALNGLVRAALAEIEPSLHPARAGHEVLARAEGKSDRGKGMMDTLRGLVNQMPG